jgi:hypothetical protein
MHAPLQHIIGTIALISLVIAAGVSYTIITSYMEAEANKQQLTQIAENVALNLAEITSLINFANFPGNIQMKTLKLPSNIANKAYTIQLINETTQGCYVQTQLATRRDINAKSLIPINSNQTHIELVTEDQEAPPMIINSGMVYGGAPDIVVWGWKYYANTTRIGLGTLQEEG